MSKPQPATIGSNLLTALAVAWFPATAGAAVVRADATPARLDRAAEAADQFEQLLEQLADRKWFRKIGDQARHAAALIHDADRDPADVVVRRTRALWDDLSSRAESPPLAAARERLERLERLEREARTIDVDDKPARRDLYDRAIALRRRIALANPLLDFDRILFVKHDRARYEHMCDQYYGFYAAPGGGLFVLDDPFGPTPTIRDVLKDATVADGRFAGRKLAGGSFISPELSFDGKTILFAWTQGKPTINQWTPESCYHVFKVGVNGAGLTQLTDGRWNDFDPCWLPDGRIAFVSERRGGYLRCGARPCPTYTLHAMNGDGENIHWLSVHETHEWHPTVNHDGMIVYTRWDYIDRDTNVAHHIWWTYPDGRDPRTNHGNYPVKREQRPWMEMNIRAVPGSHRYVATAATHHGQAYGSLVLLDPRLGDDDAMSQLQRLTPDVSFPEAEKKPTQHAQCYATAWPLSEDYHLCVYDRRHTNYGIYLIDSFGNKELIYRDPKIACLDPMPLRPRTRPPVIPNRVELAAHSPDDSSKDPATVTVINVYDSAFDWPADTTIKALRVIQLLPKTNPVADRPKIGIARQANARAVLGTVPVESDGSAHFVAPPGKQIYFQALDERGLAVQSMRSGTYLHPGERLTCQGCHEAKRRAPAAALTTPLALQRPPSPLEPDVDGSNPFSYPRLVQPVLDRHCVGCHSDRADEACDLSGDLSPVGYDRKTPYGWTRSYASLAEKYGFYFHSFNGAINTGVHGGTRTFAGKFGARASALLALLDDGHYDVKLPPEDLYRITLWLDCNSDFYGSYENIAAQSRGEIVHPTLD